MKVLQLRASLMHMHGIHILIKTRSHKTHLNGLFQIASCVTLNDFTIFKNVFGFIFDIKQQP